MKPVDMKRAEDLLERMDEPFWKAVFHKPGHPASQHRHVGSHPAPDASGAPRFRIPPAVAVVLWIVAGLGALIWLLFYSLISNAPLVPIPAP